MHSNVADDVVGRAMRIQGVAVTLGERTVMRYRK
jgi:hypothetical protein